MKKVSRTFILALGHQPQYIPPSWVNDGVCDCCDASEDYPSDVECVDKYHKLGREAWLEHNIFTLLVSSLVLLSLLHLNLPPLLSFWLFLCSCLFIIFLLL